MQIFKKRRTSWIKQRDAMHCGVTSLAIVCRIYGRKVNINHLEEICRPSIQGMSLLGLKKSAEALGFDAKCVKIHCDDLSGLTEPIILHWSYNHYVVLCKVNKKGTKFTISDPAIGVYHCNREEFLKGWIGNDRSESIKGIALVLEPNHEFGNHKVYSSSSKTKKASFLIPYLKLYKRYFIQIFVGLLLGCLLQLILPFLTQSIVDLGIHNQDLNLIWLILIGELMVIVGQAAMRFVRTKLLLHISMHINISLLSDFFLKLMNLPMSFFDTRQTGDLIQRMNDHERIQNFMTSELLNISFTILTLVIFGTVLLIFNNLIFYIFLLGSFMYVGWILFFLKRRKVLDYSLFEYRGATQNKTYQLLTAIQEIKLQNCENGRRWEWEEAQVDIFNTQIKILHLHQLQEAGCIWINEVKNILITVLSATLVVNGKLSLGTMLAIQFIVGQLNSPIAQLMNFISSLQDLSISLERINEIHNNPDEMCSGPVSDASCMGDISVRNLSFRYEKYSSNLTLENINLTIPVGKVTAIVGASGSGKSTLLKLLLGYYPADSGLIMIGDNQLGSVNLKNWRNSCGVVMQDGVIFSESVARNIAISDEDINWERIYFAAKIANIDSFIMALPMKYDTIIGAEGIGLSKGQKQRILIARAVYKNPNYLMFDEATNSLDTKNELEIVKNLEDFYNGKTVIIIAHRLSTVTNADNIIVMDHGHIVEQGIHNDLVKARGKYYDLIKNQLELGE